MSESASVLSRVDLNLLPPLVALLEERHVTRAAAAVGVSQSAMSHTLRRLRRLLDDELLVAAKDGYRLTPRAERLRLELTGLVPQLHALLAGDHFEPATAARTFRVATINYVLVVLGTTVYRRLLTSSPRSVLQVVPWHRAVFDQLGSADLDLAVTGGPPPRSLSSERLFTDRLVCVVDGAHPLAGRRSIDLDEYLGLGHIVIDIDRGTQPSIDRVLAQRGTPRRAVLTLPAHAEAPMALVGTELVMTIPTRLLDGYIAPHLSAGTFSVMDAPAAVGEMSCHMVWHPRADDDPPHMWLRERIREAVDSLE